MLTDVGCWPCVPVGRGKREAATCQKSGKLYQCPRPTPGRPAAVRRASAGESHPGASTPAPGPTDTRVLYARLEVSPDSSHSSQLCVVWSCA
eukprot:scaffold101711_cov72-Phaeocystis_antarctica.AAC.4